MMNILKRLYVIQEVSNKERSPKLGKGFSIALRFTWWNPLSYPILIAALAFEFSQNGRLGLKELLKENPFKWH